MASQGSKGAKKAPKKSAKKPAKKPAAQQKKPQKKSAKKKPAAHGTRTRYVNEKCRCPRCKKANRDYHAKHNSKTEKKAAAVPKGPHLNSAERSVRDTLIVTRRAQNWPWDAIAAEVKLGVPATKKAHARKIASMTSLMEVDATKILEGLVEGLQFSIGDLEQLAVAALEGGNVGAAVSAKKAANEAREKLQDLLQTTGLLPHDLGTIRHQIEFRAVVVEVVTLVHTFVSSIEALELPEDKRQPVIDLAGELTTGLEQLGEPSTNGGSDGRSEEDAVGVGAAEGGGADSPD